MILTIHYKRKVIEFIHRLVIYIHIGGFFFNLQGLTNMKIGNPRQEDANQSKILIFSEM